MKIATALSTLFPSLVTLTLGGRKYLVGQLTVGDLVELERWLTALVPNPLDEIPAEDDDPNPRTRKKRLHAALCAAYAWPPAFGSPGAHELLKDPRGVAAFLYVVLSPRNDITPPEAAALAVAMTREDWAALDRAAWGVAPWEELLRMIRSEEEQGSSHSVADWGEVIDGVARTYLMSYDQVAALPLAQLHCMRRAGAQRETPRGASFRSFAEAMAYKAAQRKAAGLDDPDLVPESPDVSPSGPASPGEAGS